MRKTEYRRFSQIKRKYLTKFTKAKTKKQLDSLKGKFLESLVRLAFDRLHFEVRRHKNKTLDFLANNENFELSIEVTNWKNEAYPHFEYVDSKLEAFEPLKTINLWIISYLEVLEIPEERIEELKESHNLHFIELGKDHDFQNTGYNDYLKVKGKIKEKLKELKR